MMMVVVMVCGGFGVMILFVIVCEVCVEFDLVVKLIDDLVFVWLIVFVVKCGCILLCVV